MRRWPRTIWKENTNEESYTQGLINVNDPAYEEGWTLYMDPQPKAVRHAPDEFREHEALRGGGGEPDGGS